MDGLDVDEIEVRASVTVPLPHRLTVLRHGGGLLLVALCLRTLLQRVGDHASPLPADPLHRPPSDRFWTTTALGLVWATVTMAWYALFIWLLERGRQLLATPRAGARLALGSGVALISVGVSLAAGL